MRIEEIETRLKAIVEEGNLENADLDALTEERDALLEERKTLVEEIEKRKSLEETVKNLPESAVIKTFKGVEKVEELRYTVDSPEYRTAWLKNLQGVEVNEVEKRVLTGGSSAIPEQTANMVVDRLVDMVPLLNEIELFRVDGNINFMVNTVSPGATLEAAGAGVTDSNATLVEVSLGGYNMNAFISIGADLASMAVSAFEEWLVRKLGEAIAYKIEYYIINGTGESQPKGIEKYAIWDDGDGTAVDWDGSALDVGDIDQAIGLIPAAYDNESKFLMSKSTFYNNVVNLTDVNNYPVVQREGTKFMVRGFEVIFSDQVTAGDIFFGSFKRGMAGNLGVDIKVEKQRNLRFNSFDFLGWGVFDCKPAQTGCIVKIAVDIPA